MKQYSPEIKEDIDILNKVINYIHFHTIEEKSQFSNTPTKTQLREPYTYYTAVAKTLLNIHENKNTNFSENQFKTKKDYITYKNEGKFVSQRTYNYAKSKKPLDNVELIDYIILRTNKTN